jgi:ABC-type transporter Mla subunit MlaD
MAGFSNALRDRIDLRPGQHKPKTRRNGAIMIVLVAIFLFTIYTRPSVPFLSGGGRTLSAQFPAGTNVRPGYTPVRVHGIDVGQVKSVKRGPNGRGAIVKMEIDKGVKLDLHSDMRMALRWRTLLGRNVYVDIMPGSPSAPKYAGGMLPQSRTQDQVELDTALTPLNVDGRKAIQTMITEFDKGFSDPQAVRDAIGKAGGTFRGLGGHDATGQFTPDGATGGTGSMAAAAAGLPALRGVTVGDLPKLVQGANRALGQLTRDQVALGNLVTDGSTALSVTAARSADLASTLNTAPGTMRTTRATLARLEQTLDVVDPLADELKPGLAKLPKAANDTSVTLRNLRPLLADLRPTLANLRPALTDLRTASRAGVPALTPLNHTMQLLQDKYIPFLKADDPAQHRPNYQNIGPTISSVGSATSWNDKNGAFANFEAAAGEDSFQSPCTSQLSNPEVTPDQKVACDLTAATLFSAFTGIVPTMSTIKDPAAPKSLLREYLTGKKTFKGLPAGLANILKGKGR